jgi:MOSC domain-containing protein YiiM
MEGFLNSNREGLATGMNCPSVSSDPMRLQSINVGMPETVDMGIGPETTAIHKRSTDGPVRVSLAGLDGNEVADHKHHGGADQAVYVYFMDDYTHFERLLNRRFEPGTFGENLTVGGPGHEPFSSADCWIGDRIHVGDVEFEVTAPRIPCGVFARRMEHTKEFVARFRNEHRPGVYVRVIREGVVTVGDTVTIEPGERSLSVVELVQLWGARPDVDTIERVLAAPVAERVRTEYDRKVRAGRSA